MCFPHGNGNESLLRCCLCVDAGDATSSAHYSTTAATTQLCDLYRGVAPSMTSIGPMSMRSCLARPIRTIEPIQKILLNETSITLNMLQLHCKVRLIYCHKIPVCSSLCRCHGCLWGECRPIVSKRPIGHAVASGFTKVAI